MDRNIESLIKEFKIIANKGWIKSISKSTGSIGITFENELKKKPDNKYLPDYKDIEIKCTSAYNLYPITLFSLAFEGPSIHEINRIVEKYGHYDKTYKNKKILFANINNNAPTIINRKYIFKLDIDEKEKKLYLCVYDLFNNLVERESYIDINTVYKHINIKLRKLAIIHGTNKIKDGNRYFKYNKINIYKLDNTEKLILALQDGIITAQLVVNINKSGLRKGKLRYKNLTFLLKKDCINKVFDKVYEYNVNCAFSTNYYQ